MISYCNEANLNQHKSHITDMNMNDILLCKCGVFKVGGKTPVQCLACTLTSTMYIYVLLLYAYQYIV